MFVQSDFTNKLDSTQAAQSARNFSPEIIESRSTLRVLTGNWFQAAKRYSGKSAAAIYAHFKGFENIEQLGESGKKRATRYAAGQVGMRACELEAFIEKCRADGLLPADKYSGRRGLSCGLTLGRPISEAVQARAAARAQFEEKRAALIKALDEYAAAMGGVDKLHMPIIDLESEQPGSEIVHEAYTSRVREIAQEIRGHYLLLI